MGAMDNQRTLVRLDFHATSQDMETNKGFLLIVGPRRCRRWFLIGAGRIGDGDCGSTLRRGAEAMRGAAAASLPLNDAAAALRGIAAALRVMGGTSGALYTIGFAAASGAERLGQNVLIQPKPSTEMQQAKIVVTAWRAQALLGLRQ
jgi:hypothetical protein